jgi:hypothetical protein
MIVSNYGKFSRKKRLKDNVAIKARFGLFRLSNYYFYLEYHKASWSHGRDGK